MSPFLSDLRHSLRRILRAPGFAVVAILTLALGIGANTAIFSIVKAVVLAPLPYRDAHRVAMIWGSLDAGETTWLSSSEVLSYERDTDAFESVSAYTGSFANLTAARSRNASARPW
jgi:hypothetical protein